MLFDRIVVAEAHNHAYDVGYDHGRYGKPKTPTGADKAAAYSGGFSGAEDAAAYAAGYERGAKKAAKKAAKRAAEAGQGKFGWGAAVAAGSVGGKPDEPAAGAAEKTPDPDDYWKQWKEKQKETRSPEAQKIHDLAKQTFRGKPPIKRVAAGGLVFKGFDAPSVEDLQVLVAKTHPKWGGYWVIPKGGADLGEHIHGTASREVEEETGVKAEVIPGHAPFVKSSTFGESGKYDLELVAKTLKDAHPAEADFIEKHKEHLKHEHVAFENNSHYFLLKHVSGDPITSPDQSHDEEMSEARYVPIKEALKIPKVGDVIHGLMPEIEKQWEAGRKKTESHDRSYDTGYDHGRYGHPPEPSGVPDPVAYKNGWDTGSKQLSSAIRAHVLAAGAAPAPEFKRTRAGTYVGTVDGEPVRVERHVVGWNPRMGRKGGHSHATYWNAYHAKAGGQPISDGHGTAQAAIASAIRIIREGKGRAAATKREPKTESLYARVTRR